MSDSSDRDGLAAEYVLGTLEGNEANQAAHLLATDPAFADAVYAWQERLAPLATGIPAVEPPAEVWDRIEATITPVQSSTAIPLPLRRRLRLWQASTGVALAIAASLAGLIILRSPPSRVAVLMPMSARVPVLLATTGSDGVLNVRPDGTITVPDGQDLELWALGKGDVRPRSLGVLPAGGRRLVARLAPGTQLLVSVEPRGGSPTGQPTGPVMYGGRLAAMD